MPLVLTLRTCYARGREKRWKKKNVHVILNGLEKRLQPFIRGGIRKISDEDLYEGNE